MAGLEDFTVINFFKKEDIRAQKNSNFETFRDIKPYGQIGGF